jgi:penicillin-binding protein-related factor A (putative recombinase)
MTEKIIENQILSFLSRKGFFVFKIQSTGIFDPTKRIYRKSHNPHHIKGVSDILGIYNGVFLAIEVKKPYISKRTNTIKHRTQEELSKLASEDQLLFINNVKRNNGIAFVADSIEIVEEQLALFRV